LSVGDENKIATGGKRRTGPEVPTGPALTVEALVTALREVQGASQASLGIT